MTIKIEMEVAITIVYTLKCIVSDCYYVLSHYLQVGDQVFTAHRFILGSASPELSALLKSSPLDRSPNTPQQQQQQQNSPFSQTVSINCDNPSVFEAFLHYIYGSHIRLLPPASVTAHSSQLHAPPPSQLHPSQNGPLCSGSSSGLSGPTSSTTSLDGESTPDTSFASVDENDLTAVYDQFSTSNSMDQFEDIEVMCIVHQYNNLYISHCTCCAIGGKIVMSF